MAENRYSARERHRQERHELWQFDEDMRLNDEIDKRDQALKSQKQREERAQQILVVEQ